MMDLTEANLSRSKNRALLLPFVTSGAGLELYPVSDAVFTAVVVHL